MEDAWLVLLEMEGSCFPRGWRDAEDAECVGMIIGYLLPTPQHANTSFKRLIHHQPPKLLLNIL